MNQTKLKSLNIVHINTHDYAGGAAKVAFRLAEAQQQNGHTSQLLVGIKKSDSNFTFSFPPEANPQTSEFCRQNGLLFYEYQGSHQLYRNPRVQKADILHFHNLHGGFFNPFSISSLSHHKPVVWTLHDMHAITGHCAHAFKCEEWMNGCGHCPDLGIFPEIAVDSTAQLLLEKKHIYKNSYLQIVTPSLWLKNLVEKSILQNHPIELIYNGVNTKVFRPHDSQSVRRKLGISQDCLVIGAVATGSILNNRWKGGEYTLAALEKLHSVGLDFTFINIGGSGPSPSPYIINLPTITDEDELAIVYSMLDLFLYTPKADNCPLVVLEAIACGLPVVTFAIGGVPEIVRDGVDGIVVPFGNVDALVRGTLQLAENKEQRHQFSANARQHAIRSFDHDTIIAPAYEKIYWRSIEMRQSSNQKVKFFSVNLLPPIILTPQFIRSEVDKESTGKIDQVGASRLKTYQDLLIDSRPSTIPTRSENNPLDSTLPPVPSPVLPAPPPPPEPISPSTPILIYTMGKVGSATIDHTLKQLNLPNPIFHIHFLNEQKLQEVEALYLDTPGATKPDHLDRSRYIRSLMDANASSIHWKIITLVREPISRDVSDIFQNLDVLLPGTSKKTEEEKFKDICDFLLEKFYSFDETSYYVTSWFNQEIKKVFNVDIIETGFNRERGYQIYQSENADILLIKLEKLNDCYQNAFEAFLGLENVPLLKTNVGENKEYQELYNQVKDFISLPSTILDKIYQSRYMRTFYTESEIEKYKKRWAGRSTPPSSASEKQKTAIPQVHIPSSLPRISIVTPSYNQGEFLEECIDSVLSQRYPNLEYIVMDGGSIDQSAVIIKKYEKYLTYWQSKPDGGQYPAINEGFHRSSGEVMAWINSDDKYHPDAFFKVAAALRQKSNVQWLMGRPTVWDETGKLIDVHKNVPSWTRQYILSKEWIQSRFWIQQESTFWTRSLWLKTGAKIDTRYRLAGDFELWLRFSRYAHFYFLDDLLGGFRSHKKQKTETLLEIYMEEVEKAIHHEMLFTTPPPDSQVFSPPSSIVLDHKIVAQLKQEAGVAQAMEHHAPSPDVPRQNTLMETTRDLSHSPIDRASRSFQVSAIISTYNSEKFMRGRLQNLVDQTLYQQGELEIIVIDSHSEQNEKEIVGEFQRKYQNIQYHRTETRESLYAAWNRGIKIANGRYIINANTDDRFSLNALEVLASTLDTDIKIQAVYGDWLLTRQENDTFESDTEKYLFRYPEFNPVLFIYFQITSHAIMLRKDIFQEIGFYDESFKIAGDREFMLRFSAAGFKARHIPYTVGLYLDDSASLGHADTGKKDEELLRCFNKYTQPSTLVRLNGKDISEVTQQQLGEFYASAGSYARNYLCWWGVPWTHLQYAQKLSRQALQYDPNHPVALNNLGILAGCSRQFMLASAMFDQAKNNNTMAYSREIQHNLENSIKQIDDFDAYTWIYPDIPDETNQFIQKQTSLLQELMHQTIGKHETRIKSFLNGVQENIQNYQLRTASQALQSLAGTTTENPLYLTLYANLQYQLGWIQTAQLHYRKALELDSSYMPANMGMIKTTTSMGSSRQTRDWLQKAIQHAPNDPEITEIIQQYDFLLTFIQNLETDSGKTNNQEEPIRAFTLAREAFDKGDFSQAEQQIQIYRSTIQYDHFHQIDNRLETIPTVSVIIVTYKTNQLVIECLETLKDQIDRDFEIILVDNGGNEQVENIFSTYPVLFIKAPFNLGPSEGRNVGVSYARGKICAFLDDDARVNPDYISSIKRAFQTFDISFFRGKVIPKNEITNVEYFERNYAFYNPGDIPLPDALDIEGNTACIKRVYQEVEGMNPLLFGSEGIDLSYRIIQQYHQSNAIIYWPETIIYHDVPVGSKQENKEKRHQKMREYLSGKYPRIYDYHGSMLWYRQNPLNREIGKMQIARKKQSGIETYDTRTTDRGYTNPDIPFITILMPLNQTGQDLENTILGVTGQTYDNFELILLGDPQLSVLAQGANYNTHPKVRYLSGVPDAQTSWMKVAMKEAKGDYILWLLPGSYLYPNILALYAYAVKNYPQIDLWYGDYVLTDNTSHPHQTIQYPDWYDRKPEFVKLLDSGNVLPESGWICRKEQCLSCLLTENKDRNLLSHLLHKFGSQLNIKHIGSSTHQFQVPGMSSEKTGSIEEDYTLHPNRLQSPNIKVPPYSKDVEDIRMFLEESDAFLAQGDLASALNAIQKVLLIQPNLIEAMLKRANIFLQQQEIEQARRELVKVTVLHPNEPRGHAMLGLVLIFLNQHTQAKTSLEKAIRLNPNDLNSHTLLEGIAQSSQV